MNTPPIERAIALAGGAAAVAALFGIKSVWSIYKWKTHGIPAERVLLLAKAIDWKVTPHELNPTIYPHPLDGLPEHLRNKAA